MGLTNGFARKGWTVLNFTRDIIWNSRVVVNVSASEPISTASWVEDEIDIGLETKLDAQWAWSESGNIHHCLIPGGNLFSLSFL